MVLNDNNTVWWFLLWQHYAIVPKKKYHDDKMTSLYVFSLHFSVFPIIFKYWICSECNEIKWHFFLTQKTFQNIIESQSINWVRSVLWWITFLIDTDNQKRCWGLWEMSIFPSIPNLYHYHYFSKILTCHILMKLCAHYNTQNFIMDKWVSVSCHVI